MKTRNKKGYTLVEAIIYTSILAIFLTVLFNSLISFVKPYREILVLRVLERSGLDIMERITREIRKSTSIDLTNSTFGAHPGVVTLVETSGTFSTTTRFYINQGKLSLDINGTYAGPLSTASTTVTNLVFNRLSNTNSSAVKISMTLQVTSGSITKTKKYYSTVILKGI